MYHIKDDRRALQSAEAFLEALDRLSRRQAYTQITVRALADEAGASRSTFYRSFDVVDDVLKWAVDRDFQRLRQEVAAAYRRADRVNSRLRSLLVRPWLEFWDAHPRTAELAVRADRLSLLSEAFSAHLRQVLEVAAAPSLGSLEDREYFVALRTGEAVGLLVRWIQNGRTPAAAQLADRVTRMTLLSFDLDLDRQKLE